MSTSMSVGSRLTTMFASLFWVIVNLSFLATSLGFIFFPKEAAELITVLGPIVATPCWQNSSNAEEISEAVCPTATSGTVLSLPTATVVIHVRLFLRSIGLIFLFATGGFNQCLSDALTYTNHTLKRFVFSMTTFYYLAASIGMLWVVSLDDKVLNDDATVVVQVLTALFVAAVSLGLVGTWVSCCSSFTELLPTTLDKKAAMKSTPTMKLPSSRAAMAGV